MSPIRPPSIDSQGNWTRTGPVTGNAGEAGCFFRLPCCWLARLRLPGFPWRDSRRNSNRSLTKRRSRLASHSWTRSALPSTASAYRLTGWWAWMSSLTGRWRSITILSISRWFDPTIVSCTSGAGPMTSWKASPPHLPETIPEPGHQTEFDGYIDLTFPVLADGQVSNRPACGGQCQVCEKQTVRSIA